MRQTIFSHSNCCVKKGENHAKTTTIKEKCVLSRKQQISQTRSNCNESENQKTPAGTNSRRSKEV